MAISIRPDATASRIEQNWDGVVADRAFTALGLEGASDAALWAALTHPDVPDTDANEAHPSIPGLVAIDKRISASTGKTATIIVRYEPPTPDNAPALGGQTITVDATSVNIDRYFDNSTPTPERLSATYVGPGLNVTQYPKATIGQSLATLTFTTYEQTSEGDLALRAITYAESVNNAAWFGWPARQWKVDDISSRPYGRFRKWRQVQHQLTLKADTWDILTVVIALGRVPPDATDGNGFRRQAVRPETDFSLLPITPPTAPP